MENENKTNQENWNENEPQKKKRGRPAGTSKKQKVDELKKSQEQEKKLLIDSATDLLKTGFSALNTIFFKNLPDDLKKSGCNELSNEELNMLTGATVPVLDKYGFLTVGSSPEIMLVSTIVIIGAPRFKAFKEYRAKNKKEPEAEPIRKETKAKNADK